MKKFFLLFVLLILSFTSYLYFSDEGLPSLHSLTSYIENREIPTLETRFSAQEIMEKNRKSLLDGQGKSYQEPALAFHPYLLLDVKYLDTNHKTKQGTALFSLLNGEMVLDTDSWEMTRGFEELIAASASPAEFKLLQTLADQRGALNREKLQKELTIDQDALNVLLESAKYKQLIVIKGNDILLHFEDPLFHVVPQTKMTKPLVMKSPKEGKKIPNTFSKNKIEKTAKAAFGPDFTVRKAQEIYLPVYEIAVLNQDGSIHTTEWNALTGQKMRSSKNL